MTGNKYYDVIIVGGSYSGLAAAMTLGRSLRKVLVIDSGNPCNRQTPQSHNFLTQDGKTPAQIAALARQQVSAYKTIKFMDGRVIAGTKTKNGFEIHTEPGETFSAGKLIFSTGIKDIMPVGIAGYSECWGISVLHCPYCHGYEVRNKKTGILGNGGYGFEFCRLISNWTDDLTLFTNGPSDLTIEQTAKIEEHPIKIIQTEIEKLVHNNGLLKEIIFKDGTITSADVLYAHNSFEQHCDVPETLGCELTPEGYIATDSFQNTTVPGIFACGDNTTKMRTVASAVSMGTTAGMAVNKEIILDKF